MKRLVYTLLIAQFALFIYILALTGTPTGQPVAQGGTITQVTLQPVTFWTGVHGMLTPQGSNLLTLAQQQIVRQDILFVSEQNECKRTELLAATQPVRAQDVTPITPQQADALLGIPTNHQYSTTQMFTLQETYELAGNLVTLWSTTTNGRLTQYIQGIGQVNGSLVFVTKTVRNGRAYNNQEAEYQFLLPAGAWYITYDEQDICAVLDEYAEQQDVLSERRLDVSVDTRVCVGQETRFAAVLLAQRTFCRPHEWGNAYCEIVDGATLELRKEGHTLTSIAQGGIGFFTPSESGQYTLFAATDNQTATRLVSAQHCLDGTLFQAPEETITYERPEVQLGLFPDRPRIEEPGVQKRLEAAYSLMAVLTISTLLGAMVVFYVLEKDSSVLLLRIRIWFLERFGR